MENQRLYAFWKYDLPPYYCSGEVVQIIKNGLVQTKEHGPGTYFKPVLIVPYEQGIEIRAAITELNNQYDAEVKKSRDKLCEGIKQYIK